MSTPPLRGLVLFHAVLLASAPVLAQATPPAKPDTSAPQPGLATRNAEPPPGGIARGVVPAPRGVDPEMVTKPPANSAATMPVIPPPAGAK